QFNVNGSTIPATAVQQQTYNNAADGLWRWMPSISVDVQGNMSIGFTASSATTNPAIKYAGRLVADPLNTLAQGEALLIQGAGHQTSTSGRWGDYSALGIDPADGCTFWHTNEYFSATSSASWNTRIGSYKFPLCGQPTEAKVKTFTADGFDDGRVLLRWSSSYEVDNLGYNVYREMNGKRVKINPQLIAGSALMTAPKVALTSGKSYAWSDQVISNTAGARYFLEDVDIAGKSNWAGPILANSDRGKSPSVDESQLLSKIGLTQSQFTLDQGSAAPERQTTAQLTPAAMQAQSTLAGERALKISVNKEGWYRVTLRDLIAAGLDPNADPRNLQLLVDGQEVPIIVGGQQKAKLDSTDAVEFYGMGLNSSSSDTRIYWLVAGSQPGLRVKTVGSQGGTPVASFPFTVERKERTIYFSALRNGEAENFFGPVIGSSSVNQSLRLTNIAPSSGQQPATLEVAVQGVSQVAHAVKVYFNGADVGTINFSGQTRGTTSIQLAQSSLREGDNVVTLVATGGASDVSLTDAVRMTYSRSYAADSNQLRFTASGGQQVTLAGFTSAGVRVMDVTDPGAVAEVAGISKLAKGGGLTVTIPGAGQKTLLAFAPEQARGAAEIKANIPSSWRQPGQGADYVVVTRRDLMASLEPLVTQRRNQGLSAAVVDIEDVYDEFNFGNKSPQALKDFLAYAKDNWQQAPRFVVLAGDGTFDPKGYLGVTDASLLPAKLIDTQFMETASDDWFVDFNNDGLPEVSIGRLPVRNASESARLVAKILGYESSTPANSVLLV
ncbi:MAG TPA: C25 family cysteine peptidase, partial [Blastocatellia bacterium]|nr:C25 family cysteine peptidase [Blastocatellia bacterium]